MENARSETGISFNVGNAALISGIYLVLAVFMLCLYFIAERVSVKNSAKETMISLSENKSKRISSWIEDEIYDAGLIASNPFLTDLVENHFVSNENDYLLASFLGGIKTEHQYTEVILLDLDGNDFSSTNAGLMFDDPLELKFLSEASKSESVYVSDIYRSKLDNKIYLDFFKTLKDKNGNKMAYIVFRLDPVPVLEDVLSNWNIEYKTAKTYLLKTADNSHFVFDYLSDKDTWLDYSSKKILVNDFVDNISNEGNTALIYTQEVKSSKWLLTVQVEKAEIYNWFFLRFRNSVFLAFVAGLIFFIIIYFIIKKSHFKSDVNLTKVLDDKDLSIKKYQLVMDMLSEAIIVADGNGFIKYMNLKAEVLTGWTLTEVNSKYIDLIFRLRDENTGLSAFSFENVKYEQAGMKSFSNVILLEKNDFATPVFCTMTHIKNNNSVFSGFIVIFDSVTEKKLRESEILKSEMQFKNYFRNSPDATLIVDKNGSIRQANMESLVLFGFSQSEIESLKLGSIIPGCEFENVDFIGELINNPQFGFNENKKDYFAVNKKGMNIPVLLSVKPLVVDNNQMLMVVIKDITLIKEYENELTIAKEKAERSERIKDTFLANISHEIRTPLNGILGFSTLLKDESFSKADIDKYAGMIENSARRLLVLLNNIIDLSKLESGLEVVDVNSFIVNDLVENIYSQFTSELVKEIDYKLVLPDKSNAVKISADYVKLGKILYNLISNAFKFTEKGEIDFGYNYDDKSITFFVSDSGPGISEEFQDKIFEKFYQIGVSVSSGIEGSGLGLAICKGYADKLKADIWFEKNKVSGTTFFLKIDRG